MEGGPDGLHSGVFQRSMVRTEKSIQVGIQILKGVGKEAK